MARCRIRLFRIPRSRRESVPVIRLDISVMDIHGNSASVLSLSEALVHLRSTVGSRVYIVEYRTTHTHGTTQRGEPRQRAYSSDLAELTLRRTADGVVVGQLLAGPYTMHGDDVREDMSLWPVFEQVGQVKATEVDLEMELDSPWSSPVEGRGVS